MANSNGWGDGAANNNIGWGQGAVNNSINWGDAHAKSWAGATDIVGQALDPAALAFITSTGITNETEKQAINNLVVSLKGYGIWSKMKAVYPFVTDNRNLLSYTEDFGNAVWTKQSGTTIVSTNNLAPNGNLNASFITGSGTSGILQVLSGLPSSTTYTRTIYLKGALGGEVVQVRDPQVGTANPKTLTTSWVRYDYIVATDGTGVGGIWIDDIPASGIYIWGAQLELGSTATTYQQIATTQQAFIANQFKYNLVNPVDSDAAFRLVFNGGWTHSANGATPNGTNGYADTKLVPSSVLALNNAHLSFYSRTNNISDNYDIGSSQAVYQYLLGLSLKGDATISYNFVNDLQPSGIPVADSLGLYTISRTVSTEIKINKNALSRQTLTKNSITVPTHNLFIGALNLGGTAARFANRQCAFSSIGNGLTDTEAANFYTAVQAYQTALSRQV